MLVETSGRALGGIECVQRVEIHVGEPGDGRHLTRVAGRGDPYAPCGVPRLCDAAGEGASGREGRDKQYAIESSHEDL
jgi:hypothetical protein